MTAQVELTRAPAGRAKAWATRTLQYAMVQGVVQVLGLVTGILVVRGLSKPEYAQYAIISAVLAATVLVSDSGISSVIFSEGSRLSRLAKGMDSLVTTALRFRWRLAAVVGLVPLVALVPVLLLNEASPVVTAVSVGILAVVLAITLTGGVYESFLRLQGALEQLRRIYLSNAVLRLLSVGSGFLLSVLSVPVLLLMNLLAAGVQMVLMRRRVAASVDLKAPTDHALVGRFGSAVKQTLPMNTVLVLQGQLLLVVIGLVGTTTVVAEVAALGKLAIGFVVLNILMSDVGAGLVARAGTDLRGILKRMGAALGAFLLAAGIGLALIVVFADPLAGLLGEGYSDLGGPLVVVAVGTVLINFTDGMRLLNQARGWLAWSWLYVPLSVAWLLVGLFVLDLSDITQAAVWLGLQAMPAFGTQLAAFVAGVRAHRRGAHLAAAEVAP